MFICRKTLPHRVRPYYVVLESHWNGGKPKHNCIVTLGYHSTVSAAYQAALRDYLKASDKLEYVIYAG